ncbi:MAG: ABC transporter permease [Proteobacteria bacterium]|nr:ABC transporter permease [Pseudomonadota bacterium]
MDVIIESLSKALKLLLTFDKETYDVIILSFKVSILSSLISGIIGISLAFFLSIKDFPGKKILLSFINTGMAMPPVIAGLLITILLWRNGILGSFELLYTPYAMIIAQTLLATPIILGISVSAFQSFPDKFILQLLGLGANKVHLFLIMLKECKLSILSAIMAGFGTVISEVGASLMVGGNIKGYTRVLTTATITETSKGNFDLAIAYGIILLFITLTINLILTKIQQTSVKRHG